jgi:hypothetical protein
MSAIANQPNPTDVELQRVVEAARDALTDEMVTRFAATASDAVELIDQVNRSGLAKSIPVLAEMVNNGDLLRLAQLARVYTSAEDALTDEMVGRLSEAVGEGLGLLDRIHRSGLDRALPTIARMVQDGDLERLAQLARVYSSAEDALTDEMVGRLAETVGEGLSLIDRVSRGGAGRLVEMMERMEATGALARIAETLPKLAERMDMVESLLGCLEKAVADSAKAPRAKGGLGGLWQVVRDGETQDSLNFLLTFSKQIRTTCRR